MSKLRAKTIEIRDFITLHVSEHPTDIVAMTAQQFDISRQASARHVRNLVDEGILEAEGTTKDRQYKLAVIENWTFNYDLSETTSEAAAWSQDIEPILDGLPENVLRIWLTGFTEMFNNIIDHSNSKVAFVLIRKTAVDFEIAIIDKGIGIFKKIKAALNLSDERHAALELAKGKFTTDPVNHTGMGVFFSYYAFDAFTIVSGAVYFSHTRDHSDNWLLDSNYDKNGTTVILRLSNNSERLMEDVYDMFTSDENHDHAFSRTIVPVLLAEYGDNKLVSRSQAKRVVVRIEEFETVVFDFKGVDYIGQAFADEIFRVFQNSHPNLEILTANTNETVSRMISRAKSGG